MEAATLGVFAIELVCEWGICPVMPQASQSTLQAYELLAYKDD